MVLPPDFKDIFARIISATPEVTTAIVWLKDIAPTEVHHKELERFYCRRQLRSYNRGEGGL
jgi:hypothetical protein